ncbi:DUF3551 domain-containing protein [Bradyrhizobium erythrophlei]|uniref:DUF3551 domain-containing protein n=1 Tax=Bradyrhizobium erythrophlei TaxID=1437360 RepID=UPI0035EA2192
MRILVLALLALGTVASAPAAAQTFDTTSPFCKHNYRWGGEDVDCGYTSLAQCQAAASGLGAICVNNPYYAGAYADRPRGPARRTRPAY